MIQIGSDPEVFVRRNGEFISGHVFRCGTKARPKKTEHGSVQVDGLALEVNIPPATDELSFVKNIRDVMSDLSGIVQKKDPRCEIVIQSTVHFGEYLSTLPEKVRELGCNPDYNAYSLSVNDAPDCRLPIRTGAGHVHLGWTKDSHKDPRHFQKCAAIVRELDFYLGLPSLKWDNDNERRRLYGKAGAFRVKPYGLEYRVLSNQWLKSDELIRFVFVKTQLAFQNGGMFSEYNTIARDAINSGDTTWDKKHPELSNILR